MATVCLVVLLGLSPAGPRTKRALHFFFYRRDSPAKAVPSLQRPARFYPYLRAGLRHFLTRPHSFEVVGCPVEVTVVIASDSGALFFSLLPELL